LKTVIDSVASKSGVKNKKLRQGEGQKTFYGAKCRLVRPRSLAGVCKAGQEVLNKKKLPNGRETPRGGLWLILFETKKGGGLTTAWFVKSWNRSGKNTHTRQQKGIVFEPLLFYRRLVSLLGKKAGNQEMFKEKRTEP